MVPYRITTMSARSGLRWARGQAFLEQLEGRARERPHVRLAICVARLHGDHPLHGPGHRDARMPALVAVAVTRGPRGARLGEAPRGTELLARRARLEQRVRFGARADALHCLVGNSEEGPPRRLRVDDRAAHEVRGRARDGEG